MGDAKLDIQVTDDGEGRRRIALAGYLDSSTADGFYDRVSGECQAWKGDRVVLDLERLEYISSAGIRAVIRLIRILSPGTLVPVGVHGFVRDVLVSTGLLDAGDGDEGEDDSPSCDEDLVEVADLRIQADTALIPDILDFVCELASDQNLASDDSPRLRLALEEILTSVFSYGYNNDRIHTVDVIVSVGDGILRVSVLDKGLPYDYKTLLESRSADSANILTHMRNGPMMRYLGKAGREQIVSFPIPPRILGSTESQGVSEPVDFSAIVIHPMRPEEGIQVAQCLYDEFGYTYVNDIVYFPERFNKAVSSGTMMSYTAVAPSGEVVGHLTLIKTPLLPGTAELAMGVVRKRYRKGSVMSRLTEAVMAAASDDSLTSIYAQPVGFHPYTQKTCIANGMFPCSVNFNYTGADLAMSYFSEHRRQHVFMAVKMLADARRTVHCPPGARDVVDFVIGGCGLDRVHADPREPATGSRTILDTDVHGDSVSASVFVRGVGEDVASAIRRVNKSVRDSRCDVAFIFINLQDPCATSAFNAVADLGYFPVGMFPGTSENDWLVMHNTFIGGIDYGSFVAEGPFAELLGIVRHHDLEGYL